MLAIIALSFIAGAQAFGDYYDRPLVVTRVSTPETYDNYRSSIADYSTIRDGYYNDARFYGRAGHGIYRDGYDRPITDFYDYGYSSKFGGHKRGGRMAYSRNFDDHKGYELVSGHSHGHIDRPLVVTRVSTPETYDNYRATIADYSTIRDGYYNDARFYGRAGHGIYRDGHDRPIADFNDYGYSSKFDGHKRGGRMAYSNNFDDHKGYELFSGHSHGHIHRPLVVTRVSTPETYDNYRASIADYSTIRDGYYNDARFYGRAGHGIYRDGHDRPIADFYDYGYSRKFDGHKRGGRIAGGHSHSYEPLVVTRVSTPETYDNYAASIADYSTIRDGYYNDARFYGRAGHGIYRDEYDRPISNFYDYGYSSKFDGHKLGGRMTY